MSSSAHSWSGSCPHGTVNMSNEHTWKLSKAPSSLSLGGNMYTPLELTVDAVSLPRNGLPGLAAWNLP